MNGNIYTISIYMTLPFHSIYLQLDFFFFNFLKFSSSASSNDFYRKINQINQVERIYSSVLRYGLWMMICANFLCFINDKKTNYGLNY